MKKLLKTVIIGIFTVSISTGCVRFSKEDAETNVTKESSNKIFKEWIGEKGIDSIKINIEKNNVKIYYHDNETILRGIINILQRKICLILILLQRNQATTV